MDGLLFFILYFKFCHLYFAVISLLGIRVINNVGLARSEQIGFWKGFYFRKQNALGSSAVVMHETVDYRKPQDLSDM